MTMLKRLGRLFTIKTRWEAWAVIWAISLGAVERGKHYLEVYPGWTGWMFFAACSAVVFVAGPKLLDSVRQVPVSAPIKASKLPPRRISRSRPNSSRRPGGSALPTSLRKG
jgi:hypothetical protein